MIGLCSHAFLRSRMGGLCPLCHAELVKFGLTAEELLSAVRKEQRARMEEACRASLATFFRRSWDVLEPATPLVDSWHFDVLGLHMQGVFFNWRDRKKEGVSPDEPISELQNLLVNVPPGTSKSRFVSVCFVAWAWLHDPTFSVLAFSTNPNVAKRDADLMRSLIESSWYRETFHPKWELRADKNAVGYFQIERNGQRLGWRRSFGIDSEVIGERADCLLGDDLHDPRNLEPDTLARVVNIFDKSLFNRVNNQALSIRIVVMQRVHRQDLTGHCLSRKHQRWLHLCIPMTRLEVQNENILKWVDPRRVGEVLMPAIYTAAVLETERDRLPGELYLALYEQDPPEYGGAIFKAHQFKWFRFEDDPPAPVVARPTGANRDEAAVVKADYRGRYFDYMVISVDGNSARKSSEAKGSDVGIQVWGFLGYNRFLVDDRTAALGFPETLDVIVELLALYPEVTKLWVEAKALGPALLAQMENKIQELEAIKVDKSKEARASAASPQVRAGRVYIRENQAWNGKTFIQFSTFPHTPERKNDRVDTMTQVLNHTAEADYLARYASLAAM